MVTNHSMDQDTRASHSKAQEAQAFWSICPKYFFADFWNVMEDILLNWKPLKNVILQRKTKQKKTKKKGMKRKKPSWSVVATPGWTYGKFLSLSYKSDLTVSRYL